MHDADEDMPAEFDLASMGPPVQGKHAEAFRRDVRLVHLGDDLADLYPTEACIVAALRAHAMKHADPARGATG